MLNVSLLSRAKKEAILKTIAEECFWDYRVSPQDIENILEERNERDLRKLFEKILYNARDKVLVLSLFHKEDLHKLFGTVNISRHDRYIQKHIGALRTLMLGEPVVIEGLEWGRG